MKKYYYNNMDTLNACEKGGSCVWDNIHLKHHLEEEV